MKNNKIKPIKKIMIFTIITVMIVSLFAVPAFADVTWPSVSGNVTPIDFTYSGDSGTTSVNTDGYYLISFTVQDLRSALTAVRDHFFSGVHSGKVSVSPFGYNGTVSYTRVVNDTADVYFYNNMIYFDDPYYLTLTEDYRSGEQTMILPDGVSTRTYTLSGFLPPMEVSFIVTNYPPVINNDEAADVFWNNLNYTVQKYTNDIIPPTDPDDPDTPTPPADGEEQGIFAVWTQITQWIVQGLGSVSNAFYTNGELTLLGYLCIIPLAIGVAFLLFAIIQKFLRLRG